MRTPARLGAYLLALAGVFAAAAGAGHVAGPDRTGAATADARPDAGTHTEAGPHLFWAFAYNVAALPLAAAGLLNPMIAGAARRRRACNACLSAE